MNGNRLLEYLKHTALIFLAAGLVVLLLMPVYGVAYDSVRTNMKQSIDQYIESGYAAIIDNVESLRNSIYYLRYDTDVITMAVADDNTLLQSKYVNLYRYQSVAKSIQLLDTWDQELIIQFKKNDLLLLRQRVFCDKREAYGEDFFYYEGIDYADWQQRLYQQQRVFWPACNVYIRDKGIREYVTFNQYYSMDISTSVVFSALIPAERILSMVMPADMPPEAFAYFFDADGEVLCSTGWALEQPGSVLDAAEFELNGSAYELFRYDDRTSGIRVVVGVPETVFAQSVQSVYRRILTYISLALFMALIYAAIYTYLHNRPVWSLADYLGLRAAPRSAGHVNVYTQIQEAVASMSVTGENLRSEYERVLRQIETTAFEHAAAGMQLTREEHEALAGRPVYGATYVLVAVSAAQCEKGIFFTISQTLFRSEFTNCPAYAGQWLTFAVPGGDMEQTMNALERVRARLNQESSGTFMGVSLPHTGLEELAGAMLEAQQALFCAELADGDAVVYFNAADFRTPQSVPPFHQYLELSDVLLAGDEQRVDRLFEGFRERLLGRSLSAEQTNQMLCNVMDAINSAMEKLQWSDAMLSIDTSGGYPPQRLMRMHEQARELCRAIARQREGRNEERVNSIMQYINDNFRDPNMSLCSIAGTFNVSESYISQYIKKYTGKNYSAHLESLRMNEAMRLLRETELPIAEVARLSGFEYKNTFYKVFKKNFNFPPNHFRENGQ